MQPLDALVGHVLGRDPKTPVFNLPADHATASTIFLEPCTDLAVINRCERDEHLRFESDGHRYFYRNSPVSCSVSCWQLCST